MTAKIQWTICGKGKINVPVSNVTVQTTVIERDGFGRIMEIWDYEQNEANTRLIAASPELLVALKSLMAEINLSKLNIRKDFSLINAHAVALRAIAKAEGRE